MAIKSKHKVDSAFNLSSMTDIIFLLLIFFMVSSSYIQTKGILVERPDSETATSENPAVVVVSIDKELRYYYEQELASLQDIESKLIAQKRKKTNITVSLNADKSVPIERVVSLMDIGRKLKIKVVLATK